MRRFTPVIFLLVLMLAAVATSTRADVPAKPNIIYIMADDK